MLSFKTTSLNVSAGAVIGNGLTVTGDISASNVIYAKGGNSDIWNQGYTNAQSNSGSYVLQGGNTTTVPLSVGTNSAQHLILETNGVTRVAILSSGQVGIGTSNPDKDFTVLGNNTQFRRKSGHLNAFLEARAIDSSAAPFSQSTAGIGLVFSDYLGNLAGGIYAANNGSFTIESAGGGRLQFTGGSNVAVSILQILDAGSVFGPSIYLFGGNGKETGFYRDSFASAAAERFFAVVNRREVLTFGFNALTVHASSLLTFGGTTNLFPALKRINEGLQVRLADDTNFAPLTASNITATGTVFASGGNSSLWNTAYTTVQSNSASWEESADILPTVTNYLSTNNVLMSAVNVTTDIVANRIQATVKNFYIKHPTKPDKHLVYSSLETPYNGVQLTGEGEIVNGQCVVKLPDYLNSLIHNNKVHIQLTNYKHLKPLYIDSIEINRNRFTVKCDGRASKSKALKFFWLLNGVRKDIEELQTEV
jgi:hypothetical protein